MGAGAAGFKRRQWAVLLLIVALAGGLRIYDLKDVPAGLFCDEAGLGYNAYTLATAGVDENGRPWPLYVWSFGVSYKNPVFIYAAMLPVKLVGLDEFSVRLTAALFGIGTVIGMFFLGRALFHPWVGLWSALFLAVCPWHLHFSRIAFELISFPFLFVVGCTLLVRFTQGRRTLPAALFFFGLCIYAYAIATLFVPLFLIGFGLLYLPSLWRHWRQTLLAFAVVAATLAPAAWFFSHQQGTGTRYFRQTTFLDPNQPWRPQAERFARNYAEFFSPAFLVERGDPLVRHAVRGFGELHPFYIPFLLLGVAAALLRRDRAGKLALWWLALYPIGPSLMNEIPSASRGIIGVPAFCLLTGLGFAATLRGLAWVLRRPRLALAGQVLAVAGAAAVLGPQVARYATAYFVEYPKYSAPTPGGFQYGYRDAIAYMESERANYDVLMLTATDANQPQIFPLFYNRVDPRTWSRRRDPGYRILKPEDFFAYSMGQRILYALHPSDVDLFSDYTVKREVVAPGGQVTFVVADVRARKRYLNGWLGLALFPNEDGKGINRDFIDPIHIPHERVRGAFGPVDWRPLSNVAYLDLNREYAAGDPRTPGNPERVCAYVLTTVTSPAPRQALLELGGSYGDMLRAWLDGRTLTPWPLTMSHAPWVREVELRAGDNVLLVQSCEDIGYWYLSPRLTDLEGRDLTEVTTAPRLPPDGLVPRTDPADAALQLVEGFEAITTFPQHEAAYPDYRGAAESWRIGMRRESELVWRTAAPPRQRSTVFIFTASTSDEVGEFALLVDGHRALAFRSGPGRDPRSWEGDGVRMVFVSKAGVAGNSGIVLVEVPAGRLAPGRPVELRVRPEGGNEHAWFMIKSYRDTIAHEHITPAMVVEAVRGGWRTRALAYPPEERSGGL